VATVVSDAFGSIPNAVDSKQNGLSVVYKQSADWDCEQACFVARHRPPQCVVMADGSVKA
jgi:hypothetical protein